MFPWFNNSIFIQSSKFLCLTPHNYPLNMGGRHKNFKDWMTIELLNHENKFSKFEFIFYPRFNEDFLVGVPHLNKLILSASLVKPHSVVAKRDKQGCYTFFFFAFYFDKNWDFWESTHKIFFSSSRPEIVHT